MEPHDVERIARSTLRELGVSGAQFVIGPVEGQPGRWRLDIQGPTPLRVTWGQGSTPQSIRAQIYEQYLSQR